MLRSLALAAVLAILAVPAAPAAEPPPRVPPGWAGVMVDGPLLDARADWDREWDLMRANRVGFVRAGVHWASIQPDRRTFDFAATDRLVLAAAARGLRVVPVVYGTPRWARMRRNDLASPPRSVSTYARVLRALAERYGPGGSLWTEQQAYVLPRPIRDWQVWNEPNITAYWSRQPFARRYVRLLRAARTALRGVDPRAKVVVAGLPNRSWVALRQIYRAGGRGAFDAVALHPYTSKVSHILRLVRYARREMRRAGDRRRPVWLTEVSWPASAKTASSRPSFETDDAGQARLLRRTLVVLARHRRKLRIARVAWYTWISAEGATTPTWAGYAGLRRVRDGRTVTAPSLRAFRRTVTRLRG